MPVHRLQIRRVRTLTDDEGNRFALREEAGPGRSYGMGFHIVFDQALQKIIGELRHASSIRVFLALPEYLSWTEFRPLKQEDLADRLGIDGASVSRALADLLNREIIERRGKGPVTQWRLSLNWGWRGNAASYHAAVRGRGAGGSTGVPPPVPCATNVAEGIEGPPAPPPKRQRNLTLLRPLAGKEATEAT